MKIKSLYSLYVFTFPFIFFMGLKEIIIFLIFSTSIYLKYLKQDFIISKKYLNTTLFISFYLFIAFMFSFIFISYNFDYNLSFVLHRLETQVIRFIFILIEIYIGIKILTYITEKDFIRLLYLSLSLTIILAIYQNIAYIYNLPIWGLFLLHNDKFAIDQIAGFRNNALCGEPKYLSVYMAVSFFLIKDMIGIYLKKSFGLILLSLILFIFLKTASANGLIAILILIFLNLYIKNKKIFFVLILGIPTLLHIFLNNYELFIIRPSHLMLLDTLQNGTINMSMMDDLVYLPYLAWSNYEFMLPFGFGLGLLHFYAANFIDEAQWFNLSAGYIDSNVALVSYISNFGFILVLFLTIYIIYSGNKNLIFFKDSEKKILIRFSLYSFFVGLFIGGNLTVMIFFSIGLITYYNQIRTCANNEN